MKNEPSRNVPSQIVVGLFVIGLGLLFLLDNLDIFEFNNIAAYWPAVFILFGVLKLMDTSSAKGRVVGFVLIGVGTVLTLDRLDFIDFNWRMLWPVMIIAVGGAVIYKAMAGRNAVDTVMQVAEAGDVKESKDAQGAQDSKDSVVDITAILGGFERRITTPHFRGGEVTAVMGGCDLDLRGSSIEGEAVIHVFAAMGGITLKVPPDWTVILHGTPIMGGFEEKTITPPNNAKRLLIKGYAIMGGVEVRN